jgi:DNA-binding MarR family transcriptional regulator
VPLELSASQALGLWHGVALRQLRLDDRDLTLRQVAILLEIYLVPPPHTVRGLAATLGVTKPVVTRALDTMGHMGLVDRVRDQRDRRSVIIKRTVAGALYLERLGDLVMDQGRKLPL